MAHLAVIRGLTYTNLSQVFNRWLMPTYSAAFRWTGNRVDAQEATTWAFLRVGGHISLPDLVQVVDDHVVDATIEAVTRHWDERYGMAHATRAEIYISQATAGLEWLFDGLSAEMRLVLVLRFLRRRSPVDIAAQLRLSPEEAWRRILQALALVARRIGFPEASGEPSQASQVWSYLDGLVARRRPLRFQVRPEAWPSMIAAGHVEAAIAGNALPARGFVRTLERTVRTRGERGFVTDVRIWSA